MLAPLKTKLFFTSASDNVDSFKSILDKGMCINYTNTNNSLPYMFGLKVANLEVTKLLHKEALL